MRENGFRSENTLKHDLKDCLLRFRNLLKIANWPADCLASRKKSKTPPWRKNANDQRKNQSSSLPGGKRQSKRRSNRLRRFFSGSKGRCPHLAAQRTRECRQTKGSHFSPRLTSK